MCYSVYMQYMVYMVYMVYNYVYYCMLYAVCVYTLRSSPIRSVEGSARTGLYLMRTQRVCMYVCMYVTGVVCHINRRR
jgi:hypothetical protein